jgi:hypothetical protein
MLDRVQITFYCQKVLVNHFLICRFIFPLLNTDWKCFWIISIFSEPCEINFIQGQIVSNEDNISISTHGVQRTFQDGTKLHIKCAPGYSLTMDNETLENTNVSQVTSVCQTGSWMPVYQCFQGNLTVLFIQFITIHQKRVTFVRYLVKICFMLCLNLVTCE